MKILVLYATNSGGTLFAAEEVVKVCTANHHAATLMGANEVKDGSTFENFDMVIFGSNTWNYEKKEGQPHIWYLDLEKNLVEQNTGSNLAGKKCAVFVLGDSSYAKFCGSADYLENMITNFKGDLVLPSLRIDKFYKEEQKNLKDVNVWAVELLLRLNQ